MLLIQQELKYRKAASDPLAWLTECTKSVDEQDDPPSTKPFPKRPYFRPIVDVFDHENPVYVWKSRTMMLTYLVAGWAAHRAFTRPATGVIIQSEDEDRALQALAYMKLLWENTEPGLRDRWKLRKPLEKQAYNEFQIANGSWIRAIPGDPNKIRSAHPSIVILDEAAIIERGEESLNVALATRCPHVLVVSSAYPGWLAEKRRTVVAADWPEYEEKAA